MAKRKAKFPKRIAGVKVPKALRRAAKPMAQFMDTPLGRSLVAQAVVSAAGALVFRPQVRAAVIDAGLQAGFIGVATVEKMMEAGANAVGLRAASTSATSSSSPARASADQAAGVQGKKTPHGQVSGYQGQGMQSQGARRSAAASDAPGAADGPV